MLSATRAPTAPPRNPANNIKGKVRIKIYDASGKLKSVVAAPEKFKEEGKAPEVVVDDDGRVYALDFDRMIIRIFEPINL